MLKKRILLIDDDASITRSIKLNLERMGPYEVLGENNAVHSLETAREFRPDLIFLDVMMPDMDGGEVAAQFEEDPLLKDTPIVFLTAIVTKEETQGKEATLGRWNYLAKPINLSDLVKCIDRHLSSRV